MPEYIEREALIGILNAKADMAQGTPKTVFHSVAKMVELLPAADVEVVRHGEWIESKILDERYVCSICGGACWYYDYQGEVAKSRYCPNCGAKMDGKG